ncbi:MAG: amidoligase family protein [Saccharospirillum sp.]
MITTLPYRKTTEGHMRRVGVEIEMSGLGLEPLVTTAARALQLEAEQISRYQYRLTGDPAGDWIAEVDFRLLKDMGEQSYVAGDWEDDVRQGLETLLQRLSEPFVPLELVSPPIALDRLPRFDDLTEKLRQAGATGSSVNLWNAFGLQFNPEVPSRQPAVILRYLQAFFCLFDWLAERAEVDLARRLSPFTDPFPAKYVRRVLAPGYAPDQAALIDDYLQDNPTRNRALDMLPLFADLDEARVRTVVDDPLIKARPTFHYRLPNSEIHRPGWGIGGAWDDWCQVERLACDPERLAACARAYRRLLDRPWEKWTADWTRQVEDQWLVP